MIVQLVIIAFLVTVVELFLKAYNYPILERIVCIYRLIITNCIVMGRLEAFYGKQTGVSFLDGLGNGFSTSRLWVIVAFIRNYLEKVFVQLQDHWSKQLSMFQ